MMDEPVQHPPVDTTGFLDFVYSHVGHGEPREDSAMDHIFGTANDMFWAGQFAEFDQIMRDLNLSRIPIVLMITFLTVSAWAADELPYRTELFKKVWDIVVASEGESRAKRLLSGLEPK